VLAAKSAKKSEKPESESEDDDEREMEDVGIIDDDKICFPIVDVVDSRNVNEEKR